MLLNSCFSNLFRILRRIVLKIIRVWVRYSRVLGRRKWRIRWKNQAFNTKGIDSSITQQFSWYIFQSHHECYPKSGIKLTKINWIKAQYKDWRVVIASGRQLNVKLHTKHYKEFISEVKQKNRIVKKEERGIL